MTHDNRITDTDALAMHIDEDVNAILSALPAAQERQWDKSPVPRLYDSEERRTIGSSPADPTADTVLDARRLAVREAVQESHRALIMAHEALHRARRKLERSVEWYDGE